MPAVPARGTASIAPVRELRRKRMPSAPDRSRALTVRGAWGEPLAGRRLTFVPAVTYRPASTTQSSPRAMPMPALAPMSDLRPTRTRSLPPPESVPIVEAPPPTSEPSSMTTPWEMRPSIMASPSVPALKLTKPACMTVVPSARWAPRRTLFPSAMRTPEGTT